MDGVNISFNMLELVNDEEEEGMVHHNRSQTGVKYVSNDNNSNNNNVNNYDNNNNGPEQGSIDNDHNNDHNNNNNNNNSINVVDSRELLEFDNSKSASRTQNGSMIIPSVKSHVLRKPKNGGSRVNLYGNGSTDWSAFKKRAESLLLGEEEERFAKDGAIFDLTEINDKGRRYNNNNNNNNVEGGSQLENNMNQKDNVFDEELEDIMKPPPPLGSLSRMGRGMSQKKRKSGKDNRKNRNKSLDQIKNVKVGRKGGTAAKIREMDVVKFICMRESLVARLKAVTRSLRTMAQKIRMSRIQEGDPLDIKMESKLLSQQELFKELVSSLRKASVAVVESVQEWRKTIKMEEKSRGESIYSVVTFEWQKMNYLIKMNRDLIFLRMKKNVNILNTAKFKSMTGKERVIELRKDDPRDTIALWCGLDPLTNPLLMLPPGHSIVQRLKEEKDVWEVELNQALHDEAEEIAAEYMKQRAKAQQKFGGGRGVLTVDDDDDEEEKVVDPNNNDNNGEEEGMETKGDGALELENDPFLEEDSELDAEGHHIHPIEEREPWRWFALELAPNEVSLIPAVDQRIYDRVISAHNVILNERNIEAQVQNQRRKLMEIDDTYDAITSIADNGGVNNILQYVREEPPAGKNAGKELQSRQQERNLRKLIPGMAKPINPDNIDDPQPSAPAMKPNRSKMIERLNELIEDEGVLHTGYDQENSSIFGSSLKRRSGMTESRRYVRWQARAARKIQARVRGMLARKVGGRVDLLNIKRSEKRNKSAIDIQRIARGMLGRLYFEEYRIANTRQMTDEEAAVKVQAGLRAMWARKYVDVIRTYEKTMKMMAEEEEKKEEERRKQERARMFGGLLTVDDTSDSMANGMDTGPSLNSNNNFNNELGMLNEESNEEQATFSSTDGPNGSDYLDDDDAEGQIQEHIYSPDEFDQMDAAVTIQAQVRGFVERKRGIIMESRKSQEELNVPKKFLEETVEEEKIAKADEEQLQQPRLLLSEES